MAEKGADFPEYMRTSSEVTASHADAADFPSPARGDHNNDYRHRPYPAAHAARSSLFVRALLAAARVAADNMIAPGLETVEVKHNGETVVISAATTATPSCPRRSRRPSAAARPSASSPWRRCPASRPSASWRCWTTSAACPQGDESIMLVDSRTPDWVMRGTIPGAVNIPWNKINTDTAGTFETPGEAEGWCTSSPTSSAPTTTPQGELGLQPTPRR
jgi:hypothetical protein